MAPHSLSSWQHPHDFALINEQGEKRTLYVLILTAITMVAEIAAGLLFGSMALLADGWHMGTHVAAFLIAILAYQFTRHHAQDPDYTFGTGKAGVLGGFASAVALGVVALLMLAESLHRLASPTSIHFDEAIAIALLGLGVNLASAWLLRDGHQHHQHGDQALSGHPADARERDHIHDHDHDHADPQHSHRFQGQHQEEVPGESKESVRAFAADSDHHHGHSHPHHHQDHNLAAAYMHVMADALTSVLAIIALLAGKYLGWNWLDASMGLVGAIIIARWSWSLVVQTGPILLDASIDRDYRKAIARTIEADADNRICDLHVWRVGANHYAAIVSLMTHQPRPTEHYRQLLSRFDRLSHLTIEVNTCRDALCPARGESVSATT